MRPAACSLRSARAVPPPFSPNSGTQAPRIPAPSPQGQSCDLGTGAFTTSSPTRARDPHRGRAEWLRSTQLRTYLRASEPTPSPPGSQTQQEGDLHSEPESALEPSAEALHPGGLRCSGARGAASAPGDTRAVPTPNRKKAVAAARRDPGVRDTPASPPPRQPGRRGAERGRGVRETCK